MPERYSGDIEADFLAENTLVVGGRYILTEPQRISHLPVVLAERKGNSLRFITRESGLEEVTVALTGVSRGNGSNTLYVSSPNRQKCEFGNGEYSRVCRELWVLSQLWERPSGDTILEENKIELMPVLTGA